MRLPPVALHLNGYGAFSGSGGNTGFVRVAGDKEELFRLYETLEAALCDRGFGRGRGRFVPHITLGRNIVGDEGFCSSPGESFPCGRSRCLKAGANAVAYSTSRCTGSPSVDKHRREAGMHIRIVCVGKLKEPYFLAAEAEYRKRIARFAPVEVIEVADERRRKRCPTRSGGRYWRAKPGGFWNASGRMNM